MMGVNAKRFLEDLGPIQGSASRCVHCGFCNAVCPTSNVLTAYKESRTSRGRVIMLQSLVEGIGKIDPYEAEFKNLVDLCYSCRRCVSVCPAGIPIPDLMSKARYAYLQGVGLKGLTLGHRIFANYGTFDHLGSMVAPLSNSILSRRSIRILLQHTTNIDARAKLPKFHSESFESWFRKQPVRPREKKIVYFVDSYANFNDPMLGKMVFALLDHLGYQILVPPQRESGMPAIEYGLLDKARSLARYNVDQLSRYVSHGVPVVCSSPAASYLLREGYAALFNDQKVAAVSEAVVDMAELLGKEYAMGNMRFKDEIPDQVTYHYCCLSKALSLGPVTTSLLRAAGIKYNVVEECCGGAGVWGVFSDNFELSREIATTLRSKVTPDAKIVTESETCKLQVEAHVSTRVNFPLELLAKRVLG